ncbi:MAG: hypothetical protein KAS49_02225, partial [Candidatus Cloacimonetes bacterium]|nr:hypothetical protein [Candidatus Cloacimonadota bacterium]
MKKLLVSLIILFAVVSGLFAGNAHPAMFKLVDVAGNPLAEEPVWTAWLNDNTAETLTNGSAGCSYDPATGNFCVQCGTFAVWTAGDVLKLSVEYAIVDPVELTLTNAGFDLYATSIVVDAPVLVAVTFTVSDNAAIPVPLDGVLVTIDGTELGSTVAGSLTNNLWSGTYDLALTKDSYTTYTNASFEVSDSGDGTMSVNIAMAPATIFSGTIALDTVVQEGAVITLTNGATSFEATSDVNGAWTMVVDPAGTYTLDASLLDYDAFIGATALPAAQELVAGIDNIFNITLEEHIYHCDTIAGKVVDSAGIIEGAIVTISSVDGAKIGTTDALGNFSIAGGAVNITDAAPFAFGTHNITVEMMGYISHTATLEIIEGVQNFSIGSDIVLEISPRTFDIRLVETDFKDDENVKMRYEVKYNDSPEIASIDIYAFETSIQYLSGLFTIKAITPTMGEGNVIYKIHEDYEDLNDNDTLDVGDTYVDNNSNGKCDYAVAEMLETYTDLNLDGVYTPEVDLLLDLNGNGLFDGTGKAETTNVGNVYSYTIPAVATELTVDLNGNDLYDAPEDQFTGETRVNIAFAKEASAFETFTNGAWQEFFVINATTAVADVALEVAKFETAKFVTFNEICFNEVHTPVVEPVYHMVTRFNKGDINESGEVRAFDASFIISYIVGDFD